MTEGGRQRIVAETAAGGVQRAPGGRLVCGRAVTVTDCGGTCCASGSFSLACRITTIYIDDTVCVTCATVAIDDGTIMTVIALCISVEVDRKTKQMFGVRTGSR